MNSLRLGAAKAFARSVPSRSIGKSSLSRVLLGNPKRQWNNHPVSHWNSAQRRSVWSTGNELVNSENPHPLASLTPSEIQQTSAAVKEAYGNENEEIRFVAISLKEQNKTLSATSRQAEVIILINGLAYELTVELDGSDAKIVYENALPAGKKLAPNLEILTSFCRCLAVFSCSRICLSLSLRLCGTCHVNTTH